MTDLSDLFPQSFRDDFAERNVQVGSIIRVFVKDTTPPKIKRFIVIGFSDDKVLLGTVFINSEINPNIFRTSELRSLHVPLDAAIHDFIDHDCFVDCSSIKERSFEEIKQLLSNDPECLKGFAPETTMELIINTVKSAITISPSQKRKFGL
jgi:hypothetical protein